MDNLFVEKKLKELSGWIKPGSKVLDVGCSKGLVRKFLVKCDYTGLDVDEDHISKIRAEQSNAYKVDLNNLDNFKLKGKYDYILFLDVLEHVLDPRKVINEFKKYLTENGRFIISLPNDYHLLNKIRFIFNKKISKFPFWAYGHLHTFPIKEGRIFLNSIGLDILAQKYIGPVKPKIIPTVIKDSLAYILPNNFARVTVYLLKTKR